jgi:hypothetical protein
VIEDAGKNLLKFKSLTPSINNGITFSPQKDGTIILSGTLNDSSASTRFELDISDGLYVYNDDFYETNETSYTPNVPSTSGGGGSSSKPRQVEKIKADPDIYHDVNVELEKIGNRLEKIQHLTDRHTGANWIENLNQQFETLNDQIAMTNEKIKIAEGEAADLRGKLEANGVTFTEDGTIANYFTAYEANLNKINSVIEHYNSLKTTEAQDKYQETYDKAQEE